MIISTNSGLWRYKIGDTIEFTSVDPFRIKITNPNGVAIQNVTVEASVDVPGYREEAYFIGVTGLDGVVEFEYDYEAVFKVLGTRGENPFTHIGCGFIKLEPKKL